jgi:hypothetical protein
MEKFVSYIKNIAGNLNKRAFIKNDISYRNINYIIEYD